MDIGADRAHAQAKASRRAAQIPLTLKVAYTAFVVAHISLNWPVYGPLNFLWFCDIAVLTVLVGIWFESRLLISIASVEILIPLTLWGLDLAGRILLHRYLLGFAGYMFDRHIPLRIRMVSTFHIWLPILLIYLLIRVGYDRRAFLIQVVVCFAVLLTSRLVSAPPHLHHVMHESMNINWVYGGSDDAPQTAMPGALYLAVMMVGYPIVIYFPTHLILTALFARKSLPATGTAAFPDSMLTEG